MHIYAYIWYHAPPNIFCTMTYIDKKVELTMAHKLFTLHNASGHWKGGHISTNHSEHHSSPHCKCNTIWPLPPTPMGQAKRLDILIIWTTVCNVEWVNPVPSLVFHIVLENTCQGMSHPDKLLAPFFRE